jgi:hypothetical protein
MGQVWSLPTTVGAAKVASASAANVVDAEFHSSHVDKPKVTMTVGIPVCARHEMMSKDTNQGVVGQATRGIIDKVGVRHFKGVAAAIVA